MFIESAVPGLFVFENFLSQEEEEELLGWFDGAHGPQGLYEWAHSRTAARRVQFFIPWQELQNRVVKKADDGIKDIPPPAMLHARRIIEAAERVLPSARLDEYRLDEKTFVELQANEYQG